MRLVAGDNFFMRDSYAWGCHPDTGISFKIGPAMVPDYATGELVVVDDAITCWGGELDQPEGHTPMDRQGRCLGAVDRVISVYEFAPPWLGGVPRVVVP